MASIPKLLADVVSVMIKKAEVKYTLNYNERFKKIVIQGEDLKGVRCKPGAQIEPRVSGTEFRHYNPSAFDSTTGTCEMLIYLHQKGPGSDWAANAKEGDTVYMMGPANKISLNTDAKIIVMLGDETAIGTFLFMQNGMSTSQQLSGTVEVEEEIESLASTIGLQLPFIIRETQNGKVLLNWLERNFASHTQSIFYLLGNENSNTILRNFLKEKGVQNSQIVIRAYWKEGKKGL